MTQLKKLIKTSGVMAVVTMAIAACNSSNHHEGMALEGTLRLDSIDDFVMIYNEEGDITRSHSVELTTDSEGRFQIPDSVIPAGGTHVQILADDKGFFAAWLEPGKTAVMEINPDTNNGTSAVFSGDNADINTFFNNLTTTYDIMVFSPQDPSERKPYAESVAYLEECKKRLENDVNNIQDKEKQEYYRRYSKLMAARMMGFLIEDKAYDNDGNPYDDPEYQKLIAMADPNDDIALETGMVYLWLNNKTKDLTGSIVEKSVTQLKAIDENIENKRTRKALYNMVPNNFFAYNKPTPQQAADFMKAYGEMAKEYPEFIDEYTLRSQAVKEIKEGDTISFDPEIMDATGKKCKLSDLFGDDILYIDFWATWCGPCCKQIPHLEKMVERMKDVKGIKFISISADSDQDAWKKKLAKDNPTWSQYIFSGNDGESFMTAMNITGIPRFMIIGKDGRIIAPDASMPSDPNTEQTLRNLVK